MLCVHLILLQLSVVMWNILPCVHAVCTSDTSPVICGDVEHFAMCADFCLVKTICTRITEIEFFFQNCYQKYPCMFL